MEIVRKISLTSGDAALAWACLLYLFAAAPRPAEGQLVINGQWSPWSTLKSFCTEKDNLDIMVPCGGGYMKRFRSCSNPTPQGGGAACPGNDTDWASCNTEPCPLDGEFNWSVWTDCSERCGRGTMRRYVMCGGQRERLPKMTAEHVTAAQRPSRAYMTVPPTQNTPPPDVSTQVPYGSVASTPAPVAGAVAWMTFWELAKSERCAKQPEPVMQENNITTNVTSLKNCNSWYYEPDRPNYWPRPNCPDPCLTYKCPKFAKCDTLLSTREDKVMRCTCQMGTVMKADNSSCIVPPPTTPTPRPIPTLPAQTKKVTGAISKSASTLIIIFLSLTLVLFLIFRIFDPLRIIHMCEELSLLCAHICLIPSLYTGYPVPVSCKIISILIHYFFTACFTFMLLESMHMYSMVASVVKQRGLLAVKQNLVVGWGVPAFIVLFNMCFEYDSYGGEYHCWLQMDTGLLYGQFIPIVVMVVATFTLIEAAGGAEDYPLLKDGDRTERLTAQISQRTLLIILPLVFASFLTGTIAEYEQQVPLYGTFTILNGVTGGVIFFFHVSSHAMTRELLMKVKRKIFGDKTKEETPKTVE